MTPSKLSELILASSSFEDLQTKVRQQLQKERVLPAPSEAFNPYSADPQNQLPSLSQVKHLR